MKIKTLKYIHRLLKEAENTAANYYRAARDLQYEYEESETASRDLVKRQTAAADELMQEHIKAANALQDFESHEW